MENEVKSRKLFIEEVKKEIRIWSDNIDIVDASNKYGPLFIIKATTEFKGDTIAVSVEVEPERVYTAYAYAFTRTLLKSIKAIVLKSIPKEQRWIFNDRF